MLSQPIQAASAAIENTQPQQDSPQVQKSDFAQKDIASPTCVSTKAQIPKLSQESIPSWFEMSGWRTEEAFTLWLFIVGMSCFVLGLIARLTSLALYLAIMLISAYIIFRQTMRKEVKQVVREVLHRENLWHNEDFIKLALHEIPSWVRSPDWEQAKFIQMAVQQAWPATRKLIDVMMRTYVDPILEDVKPKFLNSLKLGDINFGSLWPEIHGIKNVGTTDDERIILDMRLGTHPANISLHIKALSGVGLTVGLQNVWVKGTFRIAFYPLVGDVPFIGGIRIGFAEKPDVEFELQAGGLGLKVIPGLEEFLEDLVENLIEDYFCWPNDVFIPLLENMEQADSVTDPKGLLQITPLAARGLVHKKLMSLSPDPYCLVRIHGREQKTKKAKNTKEPAWDDVPMEFIMMEFTNSFADIVVFNKKTMGKDENMGHCKVYFSEWNLDIQPTQMKWIKLQGTTSGEVLVKINWHGYSSKKEPQNLAQVPNEMQENPKTAKAIEKTPKVLKSEKLTSTLDTASGLLVLQIKSAQGLEAKDLDGFSDPFVNIVLNTATKEAQPQTFETSVKMNTLTPSWDETFNLKISDYNKAVVELSVMDYDKFGTNDKLGNLSLPLIDIVKNNCKVDAWYPLENCLGKIDISAHFMYKVTPGRQKSSLL